MKTEQEIFENWHKDEKKKGLVDFKLYGDTNKDSNPESVFREINKVNELLSYPSGKVEDKDVF